MEPILNTFQTIFERMLLLILPGLVLGFAMDRVAGRIEAVGIRRLGIRKYMLLFGWLGTAVHELSHAFMCVVFRHKIEKVQLFTLNPRNGKAGFVSHRYNPKSLYQKAGNFFIGIAPLLGGAVVIFLAAILLVPDFWPTGSGSTSRSGNVVSAAVGAFFAMASELLDAGNYASVEYHLFLYILFCVGGSMKLSRADMQGARSGLSVFLVLLFLASAFLPSDKLFAFAATAYNFMAMALMMNVLLLVPVVAFRKKR